MSESFVDTSMRRSTLARESSEVRVQTLLRMGFLALYVASATIAQITLAVLLNYLIATS